MARHVRFQSSWIDGLTRFKSRPIVRWPYVTCGKCKIRVRKANWRWIVAATNAEADAGVAGAWTRVPRLPRTPVAMTWVLDDGTDDLLALTNRLTEALDAPLDKVQINKSFRKSATLSFKSTKEPCRERTESPPTVDPSWFCRAGDWNDGRTTDECTDRSWRTTGKENTCHIKNETDSLSAS